MCFYCLESRQLDNFKKTVEQQEQKLWSKYDLNTIYKKFFIPAGLFEDVWRRITNTQHFKKKVLFVGSLYGYTLSKQWALVASDCKLPVNVAEAKKTMMSALPNPVRHALLSCRRRAEREGRERERTRWGRVELAAVCYDCDQRPRIAFHDMVFM